MKQKMIEDFERELIYQSWEANGWNVTRTATSLGQSRQWLTRQIRRYGLRPA